MAETRIKGQEVVIRLSRGNALEAQITAIKDCTLTLDLATIQEGYLGESEDRFDDVVHGASGSLTITHEGPEVLRLMMFIRDRAQRKATGQINMTMRFNYPDGRRARVLVKDMKFDALPIASPGRVEYVNTPLAFKCPTPRLLET